ncbi:MAG: succinate--CoA ligase subunit beta, partial [Planctomycetes bacterium]|nr:succinate--CoA ligase subunit beta [Planctomycetota bacterium]
MKIHEYQAKELFKKSAVPVLRGFPCKTPDQVAAALEHLDAPVVVVKSQIHAGGRGKGTLYADPDCQQKILEGGVKVAKCAEEARKLSVQLLGNYLKTKQTGATAKRVNTVYIEEGCRIARELYFSVLLDRTVARPVIVSSQAGGMDIEEVAESEPEKILRLHFDASTGLEDHAA